MGLFDLFSNDSAEKAAQMANAGAQAGYGQLSDLYGQGRGALTAGYGQAGNLYQALLAQSQGQYGPGAAAYGDASGANGLAGQQRAQANFQTDPGYQFSLGQGLQALDRTHAAAGNLNSGNADADTLKYATGLADQSYGNYVNRLAPYLGLQNSSQQFGTQGAAQAAAGQGLGLNQSYQGQGGAANTTQTAIGNNNAGAEMNNYKVGANLWNGIMGGLNFAAGGAGGQGGASGLMKNASSLFGMFA